MQHVHGVIAAIAPTDSEARFRALGATVLRGEARFVAPDALMVDGRRLTARRIVIAAGSTAAVPPIPGLDKVRYLTNTTIFELKQRPDHLLIWAAGRSVSNWPMPSPVLAAASPSSRRQTSPARRTRNWSLDCAIASRRAASPCWRARRWRRSSQVRT